LQSILTSTGVNLGSTSSSVLVLGALAVGALLLISMLGKK
jgi:hypothetical protein